MLYVLMHNDTVRRPSVSVDNRLAAYDGVRMLIAHGHRRILMLAGTLAASDRARLRISATRRRCSKPASRRHPRSKSISTPTNWRPRCSRI